MISAEKRRLVVILSDKLSVLAKKGEITERYYNPGNYFDEVHLVALNIDHVELDRIRITAGTAKLFLHNIKPPSILFSFGFNFILIEHWIKKVIETIQVIDPHLIRAHNNFLAGYLAARAKIKLNVPLVVSLHGVWDKDDLTSLIRKVRRHYLKKFEYFTLKNADEVIAVYKPIIPYAKRYGARNIHLIYNVVAGKNIKKKNSYRAIKSFRLITINRQVPEKNPENIIRAIQHIDCEYVIVGDGVLNERLKLLSRELGVQGKVRFIKSIPNHELCGMLGEFDVMVSHCDYWGISKTIIEGALTGLPILHNFHPYQKIPDFDGDWLSFCENSEAGYMKSLLKLQNNENFRAELGKKAYLHGQNNFSPDLMERKLVQLYHNLISQR